MKLSKLLVLSALCLTATSATATIVDGVRQQPVPAATQGFVVSADTTENYYLYNVDAKGFFTEGNAWGTQVSIGGTGLKVAFTEAPEAAEGVYLLNDFSLAKNAWKLTFFDSESSMFVDRGSQANYGWAVEQNGNTFRLHAAAQTDEYNPSLNWDLYPDMYVGLDVTTNATNTVCSPFLTVEAGHHVNWAFVTAEVYDSYVALYVLYNKAQELKALIDDAEAKGVNVDAQKAVYLNEGATMEELEAAIVAVKQAVKEFAENNATIDNPQDMTSSITNPKFDGDDLTGWSGDAFGSYGPKENAEHFNKAYKTYQKLSGLPNGVYAVGVKAFYRAGATQTAYNNYKASNEASRNAKVYAVTATDTVTNAIVSPFTANLTEQTGVGAEASATDSETGEVFYIPNNMEAAEYYMHELKLYDNKVLIGIDNGELEVGVQKTATITDDWSIFDDFTLTYYGNKADAFQYWLDEMVRLLPTYDNVMATQIYIDAYNEAMSAAKAGNKAEAMASLAAINAAAAELSKNAKLWQDYLAILSEAASVAADDAIPQAFRNDLGDYVDFESEDILAELALTNEELEAEIAKVRTMIEDAQANITPGTEVTLVNPGYENSDNGWTGSPALGSGGGNTCAEAYNRSNFDIYQVVNKAPVGVYSIEVQGFFRLGRPQFENASTNAWQIWQDGQQVAPAFVYLNNNQTALQCIYNEGAPAGELPNGTTYTPDNIDEPGDGNQYPNTMTQAAEAFAAGMYKSKAYGLVASQGGEIRIGVKGNLHALTGPSANDNWAIWDNFKLVYEGFDATVIKPILEESIVSAEANLEKPMGKTAYESLQAALAAAKEQVNNEDGEVMFNALRDLWDTNEIVNASIAKFAELATANEAFANAIVDSNNATVKQQATALYNEILEALESHSIEDADVDAYIIKIKGMTTKLRLPSGYENASDSNPVEVTLVVENADFELQNTNGWTYSFAAVSNSGYQGASYTNETDGTNINHFIEAWRASNQPLGNGTIEQTIYGLPNGTYMLEADLIANLQSREAGAIAEEGEGIFLFASEKGGSKSSVSAATANGQPQHFGVTFFKASEDSDLTIGVETSNATANWLAADNFRLTYFGTGSAQQPNDDPSGINEMGSDKGMKMEFYTIDGRKASSIQQGIVIAKGTKADGTVVVRKVRK